MAFLNDRLPRYSADDVEQISPYLRAAKWGLAIDLAVWIEADTMVRLWDEAEWFGQLHKREVAPWNRLLVVTSEGGPVSWRPAPRVARPTHPKKGGGHLAGARRPGRPEFPSVVAWTSHKLLTYLLDLAEHPRAGHAVAMPGGLFRAWDVRAGVLVEVVVDVSGRLLTGYPLRGPGVTRNPGRTGAPVTDTGLDRPESQLLEELGEVVDALGPLLSAVDRESLGHLFDAGAWQLAVYVLRHALGEAAAPLDDDRTAQLARLAQETGADQLAH